MKSNVSTPIFQHLPHPRYENAWANKLSQLATSVDNFFGLTYIEYLESPSIDKAKEVQQIDHELSWIDPFIKYLIEDVLPDKSSSKVQNFKKKTSQFVLLNGQLYKVFLLSTTQMPAPSQSRLHTSRNP